MYAQPDSNDALPVINVGANTCGRRCLLEFGGSLGVGPVISTHQPRLEKHCYANARKPSHVLAYVEPYRPQSYRRWIPCTHDTTSAVSEPQHGRMRRGLVLERYSSFAALMKSSYRWSIMFKLLARRDQD